MRWSDFREPGERFVAEVSLGAELTEDSSGAQRNAVDQYIFGWKIELEADFRGRIAGVANADALFAKPFAGIGEVLGAKWFHKWK